MKRISLIAISVSVALAGCATSSKDIASNYVSPVQFLSYDCNQLQTEAVRIQSKVSQLGGRLDTAAANDKAIAGVGMLIFWPALFALGGTKQEEAEYARLKGEYDAIQQSSVDKKCSASMVTTASAQKSTTVASGNAENSLNIVPAKTSEEKLTELKRLFDAGLISSEVYAAQQKTILGS